MNTLTEDPKPYFDPREQPVTADSIRKAIKDAQRERESAMRASGLLIDDDGRIRRTLHKLLPLLLLILLALAACGSPCPTAPSSTPDPAADWPTAVHLTADRATVNPGESVRITVTVDGAHGAAYPGKVTLNALDGVLSASEVDAPGEVAWTAGAVDGTIVARLGALQSGVTVRVTQAPLPQTPPVPFPTDPTPAPPVPAPSCGAPGTVTLTASVDGTIARFTLRAFPNADRVQTHITWTFGDGSTVDQDDSTSGTHFTAHTYAPGSYLPSAVVSCGDASVSTALAHPLTIE